MSLSSRGHFPTTALVSFVLSRTINSYFLHGRRKIFFIFSLHLWQLIYKFTNDQSSVTYAFPGRISQVPVSRIPWKKKTKIMTYKLVISTWNSSLASSPGPGSKDINYWVRLQKHHFSCSPINCQEESRAVTTKALTPELTAYTYFTGN